MPSPSGQGYNNFKGFVDKGFRFSDSDSETCCSMNTLALVSQF